MFQNQALSALLFLSSKILEKDIRLDAVRAKRPERLPVVLTVDEVRRLLCAIPEGPSRLMAGLMYGAWMRLLEVCRLRIKDVDFDRKQLMVRDGKGEKDRMVPLPNKLGPQPVSPVLWICCSSPRDWPGCRWQSDRRCHRWYSRAIRRTKLHHHIIAPQNSPFAREPRSL